MNIEQIEQNIIIYIKTNLENSQDPIPTITRDTSPLDDISGFDSLRAIEVLIDLEEVFQCELPPEKIFASPQHQSNTVREIAKAIFSLMEK